MQKSVTSQSKCHEFVDHLSRAAESILFNLAEGVRLVQRKKKALSVDYAVGSVFECTACLDVAILKGLLKHRDGVEQKMILLEICRMLVGLRNSWMAERVAEDSANSICKQNSYALLGLRIS